MNQYDGLVPAYKELSTLYNRETEQNTNLQKTPEVKSESQWGKGRQLIWCNVRANGCSYTTWGYSTFTHIQQHSRSWNSLFPSPMGSDCPKYYKPSCLIKGQPTSEEQKVVSFTVTRVLWGRVTFDILEHQLSKVVWKCPLEAVLHYWKCQKISSASFSHFSI